MEEKQNIGGWRRLKNLIEDRHERSLMGLSMRESSKEEWEELYNQEFDKAKRLSDFIGMIVRLGFVFFTFLFFSGLAQKEHSWFISYMFGMCAVFSLGLYLAMFFRITILVDIYFLSDTRHQKNRFLKIIIGLMSLWFVSCCGYGISKLAGAIARANNLL